MDGKTDKVTFKQAWCNYWTEFFNFHGTATKAEYNWGILFYFLTSFLLEFIKGFLGNQLKNPNLGFYIIFLLLDLLFLIPFLALCRRCLRGIWLRNGLAQSLVILETISYLLGFFILYLIGLTVYINYHKFGAIKQKQKPAFIFKGRSWPFRISYTALVLIYLVSSFKVSTWNARELLSGAGPWILIFSFGLAFVFFLIPEIIFFVALKDKMMSSVILSLAANLFFYLLFGGLESRPILDGDEGGVTHYYAFGWQQSAAVCFAISMVAGITILVMQHFKISLKKKQLIIIGCSILGLIFIVGARAWNQHQENQTLVMMKKQYQINIKDSKKDMLQELNDNISGVKQVKFAVFPVDKITISDTSDCGKDANVQNDIAVIEINGKKITNSDYDVLMDSDGHKEQKQVADKYGLTIRGKEKQEKISQIKQSQVLWNHEKLDKFIAS